jgi:hypothetical protein
MRRSRLLKMSAALGVVAALGMGCATTILAPLPADVPPAASSATGVVQRFVWGLNHKDLDVVRGLLTDDFVFISAGTDSAGNPDRVPIYRRDDLLALLEAARVDSSVSVNIVVDRNLVAFPDTRPGRNPIWHKQVRTSIDLTVRDGSVGNLHKTGNALFFATRGDSVAIPAELIARGFKPDSTRWWLDRWEDETLGGGAVRAATQPQR